MSRRDQLFLGGIWNKKKDPECCPNCPEISADTDNIIECYADGIYAAAGAIATPGGSTTNVQFNNAGAFGGDAGFTWNNTAKTVAVTNTNSAQQATLALANNLSNYFRVKLTGSTNTTPNTAIIESDKAINLNSAVYLNLNSPGVFVGVAPSFPSAKIHIEASSGAVNTAPIKLTSGTLLTLPEAGAIEFNGTHFYGTIGSTRFQLDQQYTFNNGLTNSSGTVGLGGTLVSSPTIAAGNQFLTITGTRTSSNQPALQVTNSSGGGGIAVTGNGTPFFANCTGNSGNYGYYATHTGGGSAARGVQVEFLTATSLGVAFGSIQQAGRAIDSVWQLNTAGASIEVARFSAYQNTTVGGGMWIGFSQINGLNTTAKFETFCETALGASFSTGIAFHTMSGGSLGAGVVDAKLTIGGTGNIKFNKYGTGTKTGTYAYSLSVDSTGVIIETVMPIVTTGTAAPATTPAKVGDMFIDTTNKKLYIATGTASSADWTITN